MKLAHLLVSILTGTALAAGASNYKRSNTKKPTKSQVPQLDYDRIRNMPAVADIFDKLENSQEVEEQVKQILGSSKMAAILGSLNQQAAQGRSVDELVDCATDAMLKEEKYGKKREQKKPGKSTEVRREKLTKRQRECVEKCATSKHASKKLCKKACME